MKRTVSILGVVCVLLSAQHAFAVARAPQPDSASLQPIPEGTVANISASVSSSGTPAYLPPASSDNNHDANDASAPAQSEDASGSDVSANGSTSSSAPWTLGVIAVIAIVGGSIGYVVYKSRQDLG